MKPGNPFNKKCDVCGKGVAAGIINNKYMCSGCYSEVKSFNKGSKMREFRERQEQERDKRWNEMEEEEEYQEE